MPASFARDIRVAAATRPPATIYLVGPCSGKTGGMYQVCVYLQQASSERPGAAAQFRLLDTRGPGAALWSLFFVLATAVTIARARIAGRLAGVHIHVAERLSLLRKGLLVGLCKAMRVPVVLHLHAAELEHNYAALPMALQGLVRWMFRMADCCIVLGERAARFLDNEIGVPPQRIEVVTNGVPEPSMRSAGPRTDGTFRILFVGNLSERKGVSVLLHALADSVLRGVPAHLTLAGRGDIPAYESLARTLGIADRVRFAGWADKPAVDRLLAECDVFVLPSFNEGLPLAILEALALGVPVVCTPVGEIPHVLEHGRSAHFVQPGDAGALAAALCELARDRDKRGVLSRGGRAAYQARFSLAAFAGAIASIHLRCFGVSALEGGNVVLPSPPAVATPTPTPANLEEDPRQPADLTASWTQA